MIIKQLIGHENAHDIAAVRRIKGIRPRPCSSRKRKRRPKAIGLAFGAPTPSSIISMSCSEGHLRHGARLQSRKSGAAQHEPLNISVAYAGQTGTPKPFLMIVRSLRLQPPAGASWA